MNMNQYMKPEITVLELGMQDIVVTSPGTGLNDNQEQDGDNDVFDW